jgi:hypothetical protein
MTLGQLEMMVKIKFSTLEDNTVNLQIFTDSY